MKQPTAEQATERAEVQMPDGRKGYCCWYPQMGGYSAIAIVVPLGDCFDVHVWHDGDFPFDDGDNRDPVLLRHCVAKQFVRFGNEMMDFAKRSGH